MKNILSTLVVVLAIPAMAQSGNDDRIAGTTSSSASTVTHTDVDGYELVSFVATPVAGEGVTIRWTTGAEAPGGSFTVERSADRMNWKPAFTADAEGSKAGYTPYEVVDLSPLPGISYYRLLAVVDGQMQDISDDFAVAYRPEPALNFLNQHEPKRFTVQGNGQISDLQVLNDRGQFMPMQFNYFDGQVLVNAENLEPGTYFVQAVVGGTPVLRTVIVTATGVIGG